LVNENAAARGVVASNLLFEATHDRPAHNAIRASIRGTQTSTLSLDERDRFSWPRRGSLLAFAALALSTDPLIVAPLAAIMVIGAGLAIWVARRSPHIDERTKRTMWLVLLPALAAVIKALSTFGIE
jgi:hypothetical protein